MAMIKKLALILMAASMMLVLTSCSIFGASDDAHATMAVTTSDGRTGIFESHNGLNRTWSGERAALKDIQKIEILEGGSVSVCFKCEACGDVQEMEIDHPCSMVISCKCPEQGDEGGNAKEYLAFVVNYPTES